MTEIVLHLSSSENNRLAINRINEKNNVYKTNSKKD